MACRCGASAPPPGVSIGLINHHFPSKSGLIAETYETLALSLTESIRARARNSEGSPRQRLCDVLRGSFAPELLDPELFNVWVVFWSMVAHSPEIRAVHDQTYGQYRRGARAADRANWCAPARRRNSGCVPPPSP